MASDPIGKYDTLGTLGRGAHSTIYHIRRHADGKPYALKQVPIDTAEDRKFLEQARHEYRVAQLLNHENLIKIHNLETTRDWLLRTRQALLLIEYVPGKTLDSHRQLPLDQIVRIFHRVALGMAHMHRHGVCHADMKPNNIMVSSAGDVKVIDYGLSWLRGQDKARVQGTPEYIAPETALQGIVSERTDIFNFGASLYRMIAGRHPPRLITKDGHFRIDAKTWERLLQPVTTFAPATPPELSALLDRCLAFQQKNRPPQMSSVAEDLDRIACQMGSGADERPGSVERA